MKRWLGPLALFALAAGAAHLATLHFAPSFIMGRAMAMLEQRGTPIHAFRLSPRMTPQTQSVVRPSPDLAYSICLFDLDRAPHGLAVTMAAYDGYSSLSFFDARTDNFLALRGDGGMRSVTLLAPGSAASGEGQAVSPTRRGVILIRRLAPSEEAYRLAETAAAGDGCTPLSAE